MSCALALVLAALAAPVPARAEGEPPAPELTGEASISGRYESSEVGWFVTDDGAHVVALMPLESPDDSALYVIDTASGTSTRVSAWDSEEGVALPLSNEQFLLFSNGQLSTYTFTDGTVTPLEGLDSHKTVLSCALAPDGHSLRIVFADYDCDPDNADYDERLMTFAPMVYDLDTHQVTAQTVRQEEHRFGRSDGLARGAVWFYETDSVWITDDLSTFIVIGSKSVDAYSMSTGDVVYQMPFDYSETCDQGGNSADGIIGDACTFGGQIGTTLLVHDSYYLNHRTYRLDVTTGKLSPLSQNSYVSLSDLSDTSAVPLVSVILYNPSADLDEHFLARDLTYASPNAMLKIAAIDSATGETLWESDLDASVIGQVIFPSNFVASSDGRFCYEYNGLGVTVIDTQTGAHSSTDLATPSNGGESFVDSVSSAARHIKMTPDATRLTVLETMKTYDEHNVRVYSEIRVSSLDTGVTLQMPAGVGATDEGQAGGGPGSVPVLPIALGAVAVVAAAGAVTIVVLRRRSGRRRAAAAATSVATPGAASLTPGGGPEPRALFCPHCGTRQPTPDAKFCKCCGRPIR